jgi:predicted DNA-binding transcriptional regulator AlpA
MALQTKAVSDGSVRNNGTLVSSIGNTDRCSEPLLDVEQAAVYLSMSVKWVYRNYTSLSHIRIGAGLKMRIKFRRCDLDEWVRQHRVQ